MTLAVPPLAAAAAGDPESFSRLDLGLSDAELKRRFPLFPVRTWRGACTIVRVCVYVKRPLGPLGLGSGLGSGLGPG